MTTIKTTINKKIASFKVPKGIIFSIHNRRLYHSCASKEIAAFINSEIVISTINSALNQYLEQKEDEEFCAVLLSSKIKVEKEYGEYTDKVIFYEEVEEEIEITSYEQGCNVLKDIFTPLG